MNDKDSIDPFEARHAEIGRILSSARQSQKRTVSECAQHISTSRRRYTAIERGEAAINVPELDALIRFLGLPISAFWQDSDLSESPRYVVIQADPGEKVHLIVEVQEHH
jgi:transcriptional regulator with XRE-family HTH domain